MVKMTTKTRISTMFYSFRLLLCILLVNITCIIIVSIFSFSSGAPSMTLVKTNKRYSTSGPNRSRHSATVNKEDIIRQEDNSLVKTLTFNNDHIHVPGPYTTLKNLVMKADKLSQIELYAQAKTRTI